MRLRLARIVVVVALAAGVVPVGAFPAAAEAPTEYGYWYRLNSRQLILPTLPGAPPPPSPSPPGVDEGQVYLGQDPTEPLAVAAFVFFADDGPGATFEMEIVRGAVPPEGADLVACPTTSPFASEFAGFWENRPLGDCDMLELPGETLGTNESFLWTLTAEFQVFPGYWSFVVEPRGAAPFEIVFEEPQSGSFSVDAGPGQFSDDEDLPPLGDFDAPPEEFFGDDPGPGPPMFTDFADGFAPDVDGGAEPPPASDAPDEPMERAVAPPARDDTTARILAILLLVAMGVGMFLLSRQRARPAVALVGGRTADEEAGVEIVEDSEVPPEAPVGPMGGIGRFQRARSGGPRRLV